MPALWEFAIDVGGTFTDCLAWSPDGARHRRKVLSTGVVTGVVGPGSVGNRVVDSRRSADPPGFWAGATFALRDGDGNRLPAAQVRDSGDGALELDATVPSWALGRPYELDVGLDAPLLAIRDLLGLPPGDEIPPVRVRLGTTRGTNALLTRTGARTALAITQGFGVLLEMGDQHRPGLFDLAIRKPPPLAERTI
ncbi:MAG TPA: hydantoinase/oxoprolinase N-terminal domain-containing protein, partial [Lacipirellulaceae bacterium]|nr:hydantoinase/oxoprolinase N-terminal domain-containing protein [Lacipirellulaceae bacterium]